MVGRFAGSVVTRGCPSTQACILASTNGLAPERPSPRDSIQVDAARSATITGPQLLRFAAVGRARDLFVTLSPSSAMQPFSINTYRLPKSRKERFPSVRALHKVLPSHNAFVLSKLVGLEHLKPVVF